MNRLFIAEVQRQLSLRKWKYKNLAKATGYKVSTISAFMAGLRDGDNVKRAIATALQIET